MSQFVVKTEIGNITTSCKVSCEPDGCLTDDDSMSQFVQSETEIGNITTSCKVSLVNLMVV